MELDHNRELGSPFPSQDVFIEKMLEVQRHVMARPNFDHSARHLRFLEVPEMDGADFYLQGEDYAQPYRQDKISRRNSLCRSVILLGLL